MLDSVLMPFAGAEEVALTVPSEKQIRFADWEVGAFFHYNLNPFTGQQHGDGQEPPSKFNPTELDVEQWVLTAKNMGAGYAVLTARHEGGFCLWPSKTTDYTIASSPYQNGKGDLVRDFVAACRKHGLGVGLYHTAAYDAHEALKGFEGLTDYQLPLIWGSRERGEAIQRAFREDPGKRARFKKTQEGQFRELLANYGPIDFMWSDHWNAADPDGVWRMVTVLAEELQPNMVMMGPETWVPGNESGHVIYPMWNAVNTVDGTRFTRPAPTDSDQSVENDYGLLETDVLTGHPLGKFWRARECTTNSGFHHGGWFWQPDNVEPTHPLPGWKHIDLYYRTVGLGANTIINLPVDTRGLVPEDIVEAAGKLGEQIRRRFANPVATLDATQRGNTVELAWNESTEINTFVTMENIATGQRVARYTLEAIVDGEWRPLEPRNRMIAWAPYSQNPGYLTIGHKKIDRVEPVTTNRVRFRCLESVLGEPELRSFAVFNCNPIERTFKSSYPYLSGIDTLDDQAHRVVHRDTNYSGGPISVGGKAFERGVLICPVAETGQGFAEFDLTRYPQAKGMTAHVGIEDSTGKNGSSRFLVQVSQGGEWQTLYRSPILRGSNSARGVEVQFPEGAKRLRLLTTNGGDGVGSDHAMWAEARFIE